MQTAYAITHDPALAEDIVADAFLRAYDRIAGFDVGRSFRPWFLRIVVNAAIKATRRNRLLDHLCRLPSVAEPTVVVDPAEALEDRELAVLLVEALDRLSPKLRVVLVLRYFAELEPAEIAVALGCPEGTARRRLHDARRRMRELLAGWLSHGVVRPAEEMP